MSELHWKTVTLGDVADNSTAATKDPMGDGYTRYVIGKHIPTDSSKITTWNEVGDGEFGSRIRTMFRAGDIICTTRGPNLRVAVPDFDGLSAHTNFILRTKDTSFLLQKYLEYVVSSDGFQDHLKLNFRGSTNLFVNWSDAARYEFPLPPVDAQRRIADLLWATDEVITEYQITLEKLQIALTSFLETQIAEGVENGWHKVLFDELLAETQYGISKKSGLQREGTVPILGIPNVVAGDTDFSKLAWVEVTDREFEKYKLKPDDILIIRTNGNPNYVGRCVALANFPENAVYASYLIRLRVLKQRAKPSFIEAVLNSNYMRNTLMKVIRSSAGNYNLNTQGIRNQQIPLPSLEVQENVMKVLNEFNSSKRELELHIKSTKRLKNGLLNKLLTN